jgi:hypothetical protein
VCPSNMLSPAAKAALNSAFAPREVRRHCLEAATLPEEASSSSSTSGPHVLEGGASSSSAFASPTLHPPAGLASPSHRSSRLGDTALGVAEPPVRRTAATVAQSAGYVLETNYKEVIAEQGYTPLRFYDLFLQYKALLLMSRAKTGVDRVTFAGNVPSFALEEPAFVGRVFDCMDVSRAGSLQWVEYLSAMNILHSNSMPPPAHAGGASAMSAGRHALVVLLFRAYARDGQGLTREDLRASMLASYYVDRPEAAARYEELLARAPPPEHRPFGRAPPLGDPDADSIALLLTHADRVFEALDDKGVGSVTLERVLAHAEAHPELADVSALFGRGLLMGPSSELPTIIASQEVALAAATARESKEEREARLAAVYERLFRGTRGNKPRVEVEEGTEVGAPMSPARGSET